MESQSQINNVGDNSRLNGGFFGSDGHGGGSHDGNRVGDGSDGHRGGNRRDDGPGVGDVYGGVNTGGSRDDGAGVGDVHGDFNPGGSRNTNTASPHPSNTNTDIPHPSNTNTNTGTPHRSQVYELILHELANLHREVSEISRAASKIDGNVSGKVDTIISFLSGGNDPAPPGNQAAWHRNNGGHTNSPVAHPPKRQCLRNSTEHVANDPIQTLDNELRMGTCNLDTEDMSPLFENDQG